jgi:hypothetical protein
VSLKNLGALWQTTPQKIWATSSKFPINFLESASKIYYNNLESSPEEEREFATWMGNKCTTVKRQVYIVDFS